VVTVTAYDAPLTAVRDNVENLAVALAIWEYRREPDAHARRCANDVMDAVDAAVRELHQVRQRLIGEIRASDDAAAARADRLLERPGRGGP